MSFELKSGKEKKVEFKLNDIGRPSLKTITFSSDNTEYKMPVYVTRYLVRDEKQEVDFKLQPSNIDKSVITGESALVKLQLENLGDITMKNISLEASSELKTLVNFSSDNISELEPNTSIEIEMNIQAPREEGTETGQIKANYNDSYYTYSTVYLYFVESIANQSESNQSSEDSEDEEGSYLDIEDEKEEEEDSNTGKIIGWLLIIGIIGFIAWFYFKKYKGTSGSSDKKGILDLFKKSQK